MPTDLVVRNVWHVYGVVRREALPMLTGYCICLQTVGAEGAVMAHKVLIDTARALFCRLCHIPCRLRRHNDHHKRDSQ